MKKLFNWGIASIGWLGIYFIFSLLANSQNINLLFGYYLTYSVSIAISCLFVLYLFKDEFSFWASILLSLLFLAMEIALCLLSLDSISSLALLIFCTIILSALVKGILDTSTLFTVLGILFFVDIISVIFGPSAYAIESDLLSRLITIRFPVAGAKEISPIIGFADILIYGLILKASVKFGIFSYVSTAMMAFSLIFVSILTITFQVSLPGLPLMTLLFLFYNKRTIFNDSLNYKRSIRLIIIFAISYFISALIFIRI